MPPRSCVGADVEPARACDPVDCVLVHAELAQPLPLLLLVPAAADQPDVERVARERELEGREVELVVVGEDHDRSRVVGSDLRERLLRPRDDQLVGARDPLTRRKLGAPICDDRPPAEQVRSRGKRLGGVDRAVDQQAGRWAVHLGEDLAGPPVRACDCARRGSTRRRGLRARAGRRRSSHPPRRRAASSRALRPRPLSGRRRGPIALEREQALDHGRRSTNTSISPPHGRPTAQACSSEMPYESSFGAPDSKTSCAS